MIAFDLATTTRIVRPTEDQFDSVFLRFSFEDLSDELFSNIEIDFTRNSSGAKCPAKSNRRNPEMFFSIIKAYAMLRFMQREHHQVGGGPYIFATLDDFHNAARLFKFLNGDGGGQETKLTRREAEIMGAINKLGDVEFTISQLQEVTKLSYNIIYRVLHCYQGREQTYSGLLEKCPEISYVDRTVVMDEEIGRSLRRRVHAFQFNRELYILWSAGGRSGFGPVTVMTMTDLATLQPLTTPLQQMLQPAKPAKTVLKHQTGLIMIK